MFGSFSCVVQFVCLLLTPLLPCLSSMWCSSFLRLSTHWCVALFTCVSVTGHALTARKKPMTMGYKSNTLPRSNSTPSSVKTTPSGSPKSSPLASRKNSQPNLAVNKDKEVRMTRFSEWPQIACPDPFTTDWLLFIFKSVSLLVSFKRKTSRNGSFKDWYGDSVYWSRILVHSMKGQYMVVNGPCLWHALIGEIRETH